MNVQDLLNLLAGGRLMSLAMSQEGTTIRESDVPRVVNAINEAMKRLYTRFLLLEKELIIRTVPHKLNYPLSRKHSMQHGWGSPCYIEDSLLEPFCGDVVKVLRVVDEVGNTLPMNLEGHPESVFTPAPTVIQLPPSCCHGGCYSVMYQAYHPKIDVNCESFLDMEIDVPEYLLTALEAYVGYIIYSNMGGPEHLGKSQECLSQFESVCLEVSSIDLANNTFNFIQPKLDMRGFV